MIVFSAIVPHSPLLLPTVGKEHREKLKATLQAYAEIEQAVYLAKPNSICIIAPHGTRYPDAYSINLASKYVCGFKAFGDFTTTITAKSDYLMIDRLQRKLRNEGVPLTLSSSEELDYGYSVPLLLLTQHLTAWKLIPISPSMQDGRAHFEFGRQLKRVLHAEEARVVVIASADLSHKLSHESPAGDSTEGPLFDQAVRDSLANKDPNTLFSLDSNIVENAAQCGFRPISTLFGVLDGMNLETKVLSYEAPFGVGYLTARFDLK
ncbi:AmmeMemoRadiSam system protein B [Patescibacteria group bacterium]|nr:AmmeMemoRadiSam system protein B [Patescibacteria group bacterium]MBU1034608.1 AmmeMemoRadiSam system protein B [Patescibacteria group bacterium]MBU1629468.1 AmmeMemoRadiSam system protein B [Patescibacteria group bacterium]MBU1908226.1 AmmeMemoRadiSam system protein B [Patescibacteria group bacterium]